MRAELRAAEARLPELDPSVERMPARQGQILRAMAALDRGDRAGVIAAAAAARAAGQHDLAWILDLLSAPAGSMGAPEAGLAGPAPDLLGALATWRRGKAARGSDSLRRLATRRPVLRALLDVLGRRRQPTGTVRDLKDLSERAASVAVAALAAGRRARVDLAAELRRELPDCAFDLSRYDAQPGGPGAPPTLQRWLDDPATVWGREQSLAAVQVLDRPGGSSELLSALLLAIHARLASGHGPALLEPVRACRRLAARQRHAEQLVEQLDVLERRLAALFDPRRALGPLLTVWRRCVARPTRERLFIAGRVLDVLLAMVTADEDPPDELRLSVDLVAYFILHTEDAAKRARVLASFGWMFPPEAFNKLLERVDPAERVWLQAELALTEERLDDVLAGVVALAGAGQHSHANRLFRGVLAEFGAGARSPRFERAFERTLSALRVIHPRVLDPDLLPLILALARDLRSGVEAARALVRDELAQPLPDGDRRAAQHLLAYHLLGDEAGAQEVMRRLGRWLRGADPDRADDLALGVLVDVYDDLELGGAPDAVRRLTAPLTSFFLREGSERSFHALRRGLALMNGRAGLALWVREHVARLGDMWRDLFAGEIGALDEIFD